jgi:hypothetical protein
MPQTLTAFESCLALVVVFLPGLAVGQTPPGRAEAPEPRWSVEVLGGWASLAPSDLNAFWANREASTTTYYEGLVKYYKSVYGQNYAGAVFKEGAFPLIDRSWTGGVRVSYQLTRRIGALVAFDYLSRVQSASVNRQYQSTMTNPNAVYFQENETLTYDLPHSLVSVRSYAPSAGLQWTIVRDGPVRIDALVQGGSAWGSCRIAEDMTETTTSIRLGRTWTTRISGHGIAATGVAGLRAGWSVSRRWGVLVEASYLRQRFSAITGSLEETYTAQDGDATSTERQTSSAVSGRWRMVPYSLTTAFVTYNKPYPRIGNEQNPPFTLDLSGARVRVGLALRLRKP